MLRSLLTSLFVLRVMGVQELKYPCPTEGDDRRCSPDPGYNFNFETDCKTNVSFLLPEPLDDFFLTYTCYNASTGNVTDQGQPFFFAHNQQPTNVLNLNLLENVYCTFTSCAQDTEKQCSYVKDNFYTCSWSADVSSTSVHLSSSPSMLLSTSVTIERTSNSPEPTVLPLSTTSSPLQTSRPTTRVVSSGGVPSLLVVLVMVLAVTTVAVMTFVFLLLMVCRLSRSKGEASLSTVPFNARNSGVISKIIIQDDEISLAPSVTTIYAMAYSNVYSNAADVLKGISNLHDIGQEIVPSADMAENLPSYKAGSCDPDSRWKTDSVITTRSHDNRFSSQTAQQEQNDDGVETRLTPSHPQPIVSGSNASMSTPTSSTSTEFLSQDDDPTKRTVLSSSNDGYMSSDASEYKQCHVSVFSASDYQSAPLPTMPRPSSSLSDLSPATEFQEEEEAIGEEIALNPASGDSYVHPSFGAMVPGSDGDSGYKQADLFLFPQLPELQSPPLTASVLDKTGLLDGFEAGWEEHTEEGIPSPSGACTQDLSLLPSGQRKESHMTLDSSGYLKDDLTSIPSFQPNGREEDEKDLACLPFGLESRGSQVVPALDGYLEDNLTSPPSFQLNGRGENENDLARLPVGLQSQGSQVVLASDGYLKDHLTSPLSCKPQGGETDLDSVRLVLDERSSGRQVSLDLCGYLQDGLVSSPWAIPAHNGRVPLDMIHFPVSTVDGAGDASLQTSMDFVTEYELESGCPLDLVQPGQGSDGCMHAAMQSMHAAMQSEQKANRDTHATMQPKQKSDDCIHATMQSGQDSNGYIHPAMHSKPDANGYIHATMQLGQVSDAVMQSGQDSEGYHHSGLEPLPIFTDSAKDLHPCYNSNVMEDPFLQAKEGNDQSKKHFSVPGSENDIETNLKLGNRDDHVKCDVLSVQPVQSFILGPTYRTSHSKVSGSSGYVKSNNFFSIPSPARMPLPVFQNTDDYIYT